MRDFQKEIERTVEKIVVEVFRTARAKAVDVLEAELGDRRAREAVAEAVRRLRRVQTPRRPPGRPWGTKAVKRTPDQLGALAVKFMACVKENPGLRIEQINHRLMTSTRELRKPVSSLVAAGQIRTEGEKRSRRYFVADAGDGEQRASGQHDHATERGSEVVAA
jgi:hypothetical protein